MRGSEQLMTWLTLSWLWKLTAKHSLLAVFMIPSIIHKLKMSTPVLLHCTESQTNAEGTLWPRSPCLLHCCTSYLKYRRGEAGEIMTVPVLEPRGKAMLKEDQENSRYLLSAPSVPHWHCGESGWALWPPTWLSIEILQFKNQIHAWVIKLSVSTEIGQFRRHRGMNYELDRIQGPPLEIVVPFSALQDSDNKEAKRQ